MLDGRIACESQLERLITLRSIDDLWADYLARLEDFRAGIPWQAYAASPGFIPGLSGGSPLSTFLRQIDVFQLHQQRIEFCTSVIRIVVNAGDTGVEGYAVRGAYIVEVIFLG